MMGTRLSASPSSVLEKVALQRGNLRCPDQKKEDTKMKGTKFYGIGIALTVCVLALLSTGGAGFISDAWAETNYYVRQDAPDDAGVPNGDPSNPDDCWQTISKAFAVLVTNEGGTLENKGEFIIRVEDEGVYEESVTLDGLTTTSADTLTLRKDPSLNGKPTIDSTVQSGDAIAITTVAYLTIEGFILKANQTIDEVQILHADQTNLTTGQLIIENNTFVGQGSPNEAGANTNMLRIVPIQINTVISGNEFKNDYDYIDSRALLAVWSNTAPASIPEVTISDNVFHDNVDNAMIYLSDQYNTVVVERNRIYDNQQSSSGRAKGGMIEFDNFSDNDAIVKNNLIYNNDLSLETGRYGINIWTHGTTTAGNNTISIYNNTIYNNDGAGGIGIEGDITSNLNVSNNIIWATPDGNYCVYLEAGAEAGLTSATNLFYADFDNDGVYDSATDYVACKKTGRGKKKFKTYLLTDWQATYEVEPNYSLYDGPSFVSTDPIDLHITVSSPCRDRGVNLTEVTDDIDGDARSPGSYDIGADEFVGDVHDVAIISIDVPSEVEQGSVFVDVVVKNEGTFTETTTVTLTDTPPEGGSAGTISPVSRDVTLSAGASETETFTWDTTVASLGMHTLKAEASVVPGETDTADNLKETTVDVVAVQPMHVSAIGMSLKEAGPNVNAIATVTIVNASGVIGVEGATVHGHWSGLTSDIDEGVTDASGKVSLNSDKLRNPAGTFTFTVDNVEKAGWTYNPNANVETSDSISTPPAAPALVGAGYVTELGQAFPSLSNPETWIPFTLSRSEHVVIKIYNLAGKLVKTLDLGDRPTGAYLSRDKAAYWDGRNTTGEKVSSGIYFYLMEAGSFRGARKLVVLR